MAIKVLPEAVAEDAERLARFQRALLAVPLTTSPTFSPGVPKVLFQGRYEDVGAVDNYAVAPDGRFLFMKSVEGSSKLALELVLNWPVELDRVAPAGKK